ncbi:MAG: antibiotic biosynthesis monooxygenase family protein [Noviherbaspirillum sp.]
MFAVIFEVLPSETGYQRYLDIAAALRPKLDAIEGFVSIERFRSISNPGWILSLSFWRDQTALVRWRGDGEHHAAQSEGRLAIFTDYRIRVVQMLDGADDGGGNALIGLHEHAPDNDDTPHRRYESLSNAGKQVCLYDFNNSRAALAWQAQATANAAAPAHVLRGTVLRDYGLFDRQQAPQHFASAKRHR